MQHDFREAVGAAEQQELSTGARFGSYRIERLIGTGGMGAVYEATHTGLEKRVALKMLHAHVAAEPEAVDRFLREGRAASRIGHPNVVNVTDVGVQDGTPYLVLELLEGESLEARLRREGRVAPEEIAEVLLPVLDALQAAHDAGIVHRDLKPENIFLARGTHGLQPKVLDFGISKLSEPTSDRAPLTATNSFLGTPNYMSPEQARTARDVDLRSDIHSLGSIVYEMATGSRAYPQDSLYDVLFAIVEGAVEPPRQICPDIPEDLEALIVRAMATTPEERFQSAHEMAAALLPFAGKGVSGVWSKLLDRPDHHEDSAAIADRPSATAATMASPTPQPKSIPRLTASLGVDRDEPSDAVGAMDSSLSDDPGSLVPPTTSPTRYLLAGAGAAVLLVLVVGLTQWSMDGEDEASGPASFDLRLTAEPASAELELDGESVGRGSLDTTLPADGASHTLVVRADGYASETLEFRDAPPDRGHVSLLPVALDAPEIPAEVPEEPAESDDEAEAEAVDDEPPSTRSRERVRTRSADREPAPRLPVHPPEVERPAPPRSVEVGANGARILD